MDGTLLESSAAAFRHGRLRPPEEVKMSLENRHAVEIAHMERVLRSYGGVLTRARLFDECGACHWPVLDTFRAALEEGIASGRLRALGDELIEVPAEEEERRSAAAG